MKHLLWLLLAALSCQAQIAEYATETVLAAGTNNIAASGTNTPSWTLDVRGRSDLTIICRFSLVGAGTTAVNVPVLTSVDGSTYSTDAMVTLTVTPAGTAAVGASTNKLLGGVGYIKFGGIINGNGTAVTNLYLAVGTK